MVVHESAVGATVEWYTPASLFEKLCLRFDIDPAAGLGDCVPADVRIVGEMGENGLDYPWQGRVWLNPPYGPAAVPFIHRMIEHRNGVLLVASRTETRWFQHAARSADLVCFLRDRLHFVNGHTGTPSRSSFASVLMAWGYECVEAVRQADLGLSTSWRTMKERPRLLCPYHGGYINEHDKYGGCPGSAVSSPDKTTDTQLSKPD